MLWWLEWFWGYVVVRVTGKTPERFMNLCAFRRTDMWDFAPCDNGVTVKIRASEFKHLRRAARRGGCRLHIERRCGLPFVLRRYRGRVGLPLGAVAFVLILQVLCGRVWQFDIQGTRQLTRATILQIMAEYGIKEGTRSDAYEWATVRQTILHDHPEIAWMSLNPVGTVMHVDLSEATPPPDSANQPPYSLVAAADGRITQIKGFAGTPAVQAGDAVVKGDVLVNGAVTLPNGSVVYQHASAEITAETVRRMQFAVPLTQTKSTRAGPPCVRRTLAIFGLQVPLYLGSLNGPYETETTTWHWQIDGVVLPVSVRTAVCFPLQETPLRLTPAQALAQGKQQAEQYVQNNLAGADAIRLEYTHSMVDEQLIVKAKIYCRESATFAEKRLIYD